ncbi:MAG: acyl carrier protein [Bacillota bacterium]
MNTEDKLKECIISTSGLSIDASMINDNTNLVEELGFHSVLSIKLIVELERSFGIFFDEDDLNYDLISRYENLKRNILEKLNTKE